MPSFLKSRKTQDITIINFLFRDLELEERGQLKKELNDVFKLGGNKFILDLSNVGFLSSLVIATMVVFAKDVREKKGDVKLINLSDEAVNVFHLTKLDRVFEFFDNEKEAVKSFVK